MSAGTSPDAENPVSIDLIEWADVIFAMEPVHRKKLNERFGQALRNKKVVVLGIPDDYAFMEAKLVDLLERKAAKHLLSR